jgi:hypothetical protein
MRDEAGVIHTSDNLDVQGEMRSLYRHLVERGKIKRFESFDEGVLHIFSRDVLQRIKSGDRSWEEMVLVEIAEIIKQRRFFGCQKAQPIETALAG